MRITDLPSDKLKPVKHLVEKIGAVELPDPTGYHVLVLQYVKPERTSGGLIIPDKALREDEYQGRVGVVLALGPDAYKGEDRFPVGPWCAIGDAVMWPSLQNSSTRFAYRGEKDGDRVILALLKDDAIIATGIDLLRAVTSG